MRIKAVLTTGTALLLSAGIAAAEPKIYPVHTAHNFCPAGLQPVTMDGTICCGKPNQGHSYQAAMSHPVKKKKRVRHVAAADCPIGQKGCN
jgi:hypothetical protein